MKRAVVLVAILACKSDKPAPAPPPPVVAGDAAVAVVADAAAAAAVPEICKHGVVAIDSATCPSPEIRAQLMLAKKSLDGVVQTVGQTSADPVQFQVMCAQLLLAIERDAKKLGCTLAIEDAQRTEMMATLDSWFARRTPVENTGHAEADAVIAKIAAVRDATCECKLGSCLDQLEKQLVAVGAMPKDAPEAARTLGSKLLEDAARCANRVRTITDPPK
jgi:hypothetical protein